MPVTPAIRTHADIANALKTLGVSLDDARKLEPARAKDPALAQELVKVLKDVSGSELARLKATIGAAATSSTTARAPSTQVGARLPVAKNGKEPRLDANTAPVAIFMQRYGMEGVAPRPLERVLVHAAKIHDIIAAGGTNLDALVEHVMKVDLRRQVFLLEGVSKIYDRRYDEAGDVNKDAKKLEDALGTLSETRSNLAYGRTVHAPADVIAHLEKAERDARNDLKKLLKDDWMPDDKGRIPALDDLADEWGDADTWDDYAKDKKYLRNELVRRLVKVSDTDFDMNQLETGIHELRRQLRWFPIYTESLNGLLQLDTSKNPVAHYKPMLDVQLATSKYVDLPDDSREVDAIRISKSLYTALMQLTLDLGGVKDAGEPFEALLAAYVETGRARDDKDARAQVYKLIGGDKLDRDVHDNARKLYAEMKAHKLVEKLAEQVKKG